MSGRNGVALRIQKIENGNNGNKKMENQKMENGKRKIIKAKVENRREKAKRENPQGIQP